jgi:uncharacterized protein YqhQ
MLIGFNYVIGIILGSGVVAAFVSGLMGWYLEKRRDNLLRLEKLYGPLRFKLSLMRLYSENQAQVLEQIRQYGGAEYKTALMLEHVNPLVLKWIECRDDIRKLCETNSGLIRRSDYVLVDNFLDGCIKREITDDGTNILAEDEEMTEKLLSAVKDFQEKYI